MALDKINRAVEIAEEFVRRAKAVVKESGVTAENPYGTPSPRLTGALRRQSLELTRALADLRNPNHG